MRKVIQFLVVSMILLGVSVGVVQGAQQGPNKVSSFSTKMALTV